MVVNRDHPLAVPYFSADVQNNFSRMLSLDMGNESSELPETETYTVKLKKDDLGLGITVAGYVCEKGKSKRKSYADEVRGLNQSPLAFSLISVL